MAERAIAVYCGSSIGKEKAYATAARSLGQALGKGDYRLIYGGGGEGIMGAVSSAVLEAGGKITGVVPYAMVAAGGETDKIVARAPLVLPANNEQYESIIVESMHDRKVEMAKRSRGFIGLPGGFGTFEEVLEVTTWTQLGIHIKPVVVLNVLGFYDPLRDLIQSGIRAGFIKPENENLVVFVDGPSLHSEHELFDWGTAGIKAIEDWHAGTAVPLYDWSVRMGGKTGAPEEAV